MSPQTIETLTYASVAVIALYAGWFIGEFFKAPWQDKWPVAAVMAAGFVMVLIISTAAIILSEVWT